jgi:hypothetical protein
MAALKATLPKELSVESARVFREGSGEGSRSCRRSCLWMVLEKLHRLTGGWGGFKGSKHVRLVSRGWRASHDALVTRLTVSGETPDEGMRLLVRRFPAVVSVAMKGDNGRISTHSLLHRRTLPDRQATVEHPDAALQHYPGPLVAT